MNEVGSTKIPEIRIQVQRYEELTILLKETITRLDERLVSILRNEPPTDIEEKEVDTTLVPLAYELRSFNRDFNHQVDRLSELIGRLEL
jgi:hypothetical protein